MSGDDWRVAWTREDEFTPRPGDLGGYFFLTATRLDTGEVYYAPLGTPDPPVPCHVTVAHTGDPLA